MMSPERSLLVPVELRGVAVVLRPFSRDDAGALAAAAAESREHYGFSFVPHGRNEVRRAIERLGARFEGVRRGDMPGADGTVRNSAFYSIIRAEWPEVRDRLKNVLSR